MWVKCEDQLPGRKPVLVYGKCGYYIAWYSNGWKTEVDTEGYGVGATHWMPLPDKPVDTDQ